jgi:hypothetical protein
VWRTPLGRRRGWAERRHTSRAPSVNRKDECLRQRHARSPLVKASSVAGRPSLGIDPVTSQNHSSSAPQLGPSEPAGAPRCRRVSPSLERPVGRARRERRPQHPGSSRLDSRRLGDSAAFRDRIRRPRDAPCRRGSAPRRSRLRTIWPLEDAVIRISMYGARAGVRPSTGARRLVRVLRVRCGMAPSQVICSVDLLEGRPAWRRRVA